MSTSLRRYIAAPTALGAMVATGVVLIPATPSHGYGITQAEYNYCVSSVSTAINCLHARDAADQAYVNTTNAFGHNDDFGKANAFQHAWWTSLIAIKTNNREFAWTITMLHETGYPNWQTDNAHQMDLHNNRVGYHKVAVLMGGTTVDQIALYMISLQVLANNAIQDLDGVNSDYTKLIYIS